MTMQENNHIHSLINISNSIAPLDDFDAKFKAIMGEGASIVKNDHLSVFYLKDIIRSLEAHNTPIKRENELFYLWNGKYWQSITKSKMIKFIFSYIERRGLNAHCSNAIIQGVHSNLCNKLGDTERVYDPSTQFLNLSNGVLKINSKDGKVFLVKHDKKYHLDYIMDFDYVAKSKNDKWQIFLDDMLPNKDTQKTLQQIVGNLLIRGLKIEVLPFLFGTGGNGKGVVLEALKGLFGAKNVSSFSLTQISTDEKIRAKIANGKIMNLGNENSMSKVDIEVVKTYSSYETLTARLNYGNPYEINNYAKFIGNINKLTVFGGERTEAIKRRLVIVPFLVSSQKLNKPMNVDLHHDILEDRSGLLNWVIEGVKEVLKNKKIYLSDEVKKILSTYSEDTNPVSQLIAENNYRFIPPSQPKSTWIKLQEVYKEYREFTLERGYQAQNRNNFKADLMAIEGVLIEKSNNVYCVNISRDDTYKELVTMGEVEVDYSLNKDQFDKYQQVQLLLKSSGMTIEQIKAIVEDDKYNDDIAKRESENAQLSLKGLS